MSSGGAAGAHVRLQKFIRLQWRQSTTKRRQKLTPGGHHSMAKCTSLPGKNKEEQRGKKQLVLSFPSWAIFYVVHASNLTPWSLSGSILENLCCSDANLIVG